MTLKLFLVGALTLAAVSCEDDWSSNCNKCKCMWSNGKKSADCRGVQFNTIPGDLSNELRDIDFSNNPLYELKSREFSSVGLQNVHKLRLQNCSIEVVHHLTFESLRLLIELDLSNNAIKKLDSEVFKDIMKLRILFLSHNKLKRLEDNLFANMTHLQKIHADNNQLNQISENIFSDPCPLLHLSLENNSLSYIAPTFGKKLAKLGSLALSNNPWVCDCKLQPFRKYALEANWMTSPALCFLPERLKERKWSDNIVFACDPKIIEPSPNAVLEVNSANFTIPCKVEGDPRPSVVWYSNGRSVDAQRNSQKYVITTSKDLPYWYNLTVINFSYRDRGEYKCIATNAGGSDERNITAYLTGTDYIGGGTLSSTSMSWTMMLIISLAVCGGILLIIIFLLIFCCCKRQARNRTAMSKNRHIGQDDFGEVMSYLEGGPSEKPLITDVNPVLKPPRQHSVPPSVTSGGTEVSETKKMLNDDDFNGDMWGDYDSIREGHPKSANNNLDGGHHSANHHPPDLVPFQGRANNQISPAGSSASTVADTSRLPHHHYQAPPALHSPQYDNSIYCTLPYSRSHSPYTNSTVRVPRKSQGYVTIPRKPRASWSSEPPNMSDIGEPLYDNLGLRTTATGASALSLNKLPETPRANKIPMYPLSPQTCDPIAESHESPPNTAATLPRSLSAQRALSPFWLSQSPGSTTDSRRESTASLLPADKTPKIPPRPPPKPKKRTGTGPLFEDEGEDGTEV